MSENVHTADSGVCRYPALLQLVSFSLAIIVGFSASIYQMYGVKLIELGASERGHSRV
ncbi:MAG: hypothetical protein R3B52_02635 [Candidatus Paceibacterota bacterium]